MLTEKENRNISRLLSKILRHSPEEIDIVLDDNGWTDILILIEKLNLKGFNVAHDELIYIVENNNKSRFAFDGAIKKIRATQGHSLDVNLGYLPVQPPTLLYHGTSITSKDSILKNGINKQKRQYVHLSEDINTVIKVGERQGDPIVFTVLSKQMSDDGFQFYLSDNNVWLTDNVPSKYLEVCLDNWGYK